MTIRTFPEAKRAALAWLREHGHVEPPHWDAWQLIEGLGPERPFPGLEPDGWELDESGFFRAGSNQLQPHWCVRYWHVRESAAAGTLLVREDGRIEPGFAFFVGCLGQFPHGLVRIEADGTEIPMQAGHVIDARNWGRGQPRSAIPGVGSAGLDDGEGLM